MKAAEILCPESNSFLLNISLSANTVAERVNDLAGDIPCQHKETCKNCVAYSIAVDESTDVEHSAQLAVFVRGVNEDFELAEDLLELVPMKGKTGADEIFSQLVTLLNKFDLLWGKMVGFVSDGAPAMIGKNKDVAAKLKKNKMKEFEGTTCFRSLHCILHQHALCAKSLKMNHVMDTVIKTVNFIRASVLNHREFVAFLEEVENKYGEIIYHTNVRWLSRGSVLKLFFDLLNEIKLFMEKKGRNIEELNDEAWVTDLVFLVDVTGHLNLNRELQGKDTLITDMYNNIKAFRVKLQLLENQLKLHYLVHFPRVKTPDTNFPERIPKYSQSFFFFFFLGPREEFDERFQDFKIMEPECLLFVLPLKSDVENAPENLQMELINLQCDTNLTQKFSETDLQDFYSYWPKEKFPVLRSFGLRIIAMFGNYCNTKSKRFPLIFY
jgi:hypothetical protein